MCASPFNRIMRIVVRLVAYYSTHIYIYICMYVILYKYILTYWIILWAVEPVVRRSSRIIDQVSAHGVDSAERFWNFGYGLWRQISGFFRPDLRVRFSLFLGYSSLELRWQFGTSTRFGVSTLRIRNVGVFCIIAIIACGEVKWFSNGLSSWSRNKVLLSTDKVVSCLNDKKLDIWMIENMRFIRFLFFFLRSAQIL